MSFLRDLRPLGHLWDSITLVSTVGMSGPHDVERASQIDGGEGNCDLTDFHSAASEDGLDDHITCVQTITKNKNSARFKDSLVIK